MAKKIVVTRTNPVVFYTGDSSSLGFGPGWYYRAANEDGLQGPFSSRQSAIDYALKAMADAAPVVALKAAGDRRAA